MPKQKTVVAIPSDTQCGSSFGLMPPGPWVSSNGNSLAPNKLQRIIWKQWAECWERVSELRKGSRLIVIFNGDAVQGNSGYSVQNITQNREEQENLHIDCMDYALKRARFGAGDLLYYVAGTPFHVGSGAVSEDRIARDFSAVPYRKPSEGHKDGRHVWPELLLNVNGCLLDVAHHGPRPGARLWTRSSSLKSWITHVYLDRLDNNLEIPRYYIRAHNHKWTTDMYSGARGKIEGFILPCFQCHDEYIDKVAGYDLTTIGMLILVIEENGSSTWECPRLTFDETEIQKA